MNNQSERKYELQLDPKILRLLGPSLYTNIYYILAELIANAYDADARNVYIIAKPDSIIVEDDGIGMSYEDTKIYLNVAAETRTTKKDSYTKKGRRKIGRKGVGKLAALSVSDNIWVQTIKDGKKLGFIFTIYVRDDRILDPLEEKDMRFEKIKKHGTSIIMKEPHYGLNKSFETIKKNLLKIFPLINRNFRIHIIQNDKEEIIKSFDREMIKQLGGLIIIGSDFEYLANFFNNDYPDKEKKLLQVRKEKKKPMKLRNKDGKEKEYNLIIKGWVGAYKTTRGRKAMHGDFPDNFISLLSNSKIGEYNILPVVGKNKLQEVYVVGQLHVDLFEETELPDMALSNRQGYKTDDPRYQEVISFVAKKLLPDIVEIRTVYANYHKEEKEKEKLKKQEQKERELRKLVDKYKKETSGSATRRITEMINQSDKNTLTKMKKIIEDEMNIFLPIVGIKKKVDAQKKKILICHTKDDKDLSDVIYSLLLFNRVPPEDIIYTNCDDEISRIPEGVEVYDYLRTFFVESYSAEKIYVIYVTSKDMAKAWGAVTEVGAGWITRRDHKVFNIKGHTPARPLNTDVEWHTSIRTKDGLSMTRVECDKFASKVEDMCNRLEYKKRTREENIRKIKDYVDIKNS
ncbi:ATP-binding protein [candidate division WOR-3 bacterium]|nr:ATP-binding protein [candidate division WOR-3 bacterium]